VGALSVLAMMVLSSCTLPTPQAVEQREPVVLELVAPEDNHTVEAPLEPAPSNVDPLTIRVEEAIAQMDIRTKLAGLMVVTVSGMDPLAHREVMERIPAAGFLLGRSNLVGDTAAIRALVAALQEGSEFPLMMAVDQEGSPVARIAGDDSPGARVLGSGSLADTAAAFLSRQQLVDRAGANVNFGLVADVSGGPGAYIHSRSFSTAPQAVSDHVVAAIGVGVSEVAQTLKHFPGHGMVFEDSHLEIPVAELSIEQWRATHALPFIAGIAAGAPLVMTGHIRVPRISKDPASLSNDWVDILRGELGFQGVIITDDLSMLENSGEESYRDPARNAVAAMIAGNDLILLAVDPGVDPTYSTYDTVLAALEAAVAEGAISEDQVDASLVRVLRLRSGLGTP